jgi:hypothetical protein
LLKQKLDQIVDQKIRYLDDVGKELSDMNVRVHVIENQSNMIPDQFQANLTV